MRILKILIVAVLVFLSSVGIYDAGNLARAQEYKDLVLKLDGMQSKLKSMRQAKIIQGGVYEPYGFANKFRVTATMLANPHRLNSVEFAGIFKIDVISDGNHATIKPIVDAIDNGSAAFGSVAKNGEISIDQSLGLGVVDKFKEVAVCAANKDNNISQKCQDDIIAAMDEVIEKLEKIQNENEKKIKLLIAESKIINASPEYTTINWKPVSP
jgi:hypothetical protein